MGEPNPIQQSDIKYKDELVCILNPDVKKGIIVWTEYNQPAEMDSLCNSGLKTGVQLKSEGVDFGRSKIHPYIFFRAPYYSSDIDYTSVETEINSSYGEGQISESRVFIRVDPDNTFVFSSEIRDIFKHSVWYGTEDNMINNSKKTLSKYLEIINNNREIIENVKSDKKIWYNLFTSKAVLFPIAADPKEPFDDEPIQTNSEILVSIPHLTPDHFVLCTNKHNKIKIKVKKNWWKKGLSYFSKLRRFSNRGGKKRRRTNKKRKQRRRKTSRR
jgi:hypothetical protein